MAVLMPLELYRPSPLSNRERLRFGVTATLLFTLGLVLGLAAQHRNPSDSGEALNDASAVEVNREALSVRTDLTVRPD